jgi:hypothetical protein
MLKTYRIIPVVFILFFFGFTLITVAPVFAQTVDQLIERIEALGCKPHECRMLRDLLEQKIKSNPQTPTLTPEEVAEKCVRDTRRMEAVRGGRVLARSIACGDCKRVGGRIQCKPRKKAKAPERHDPPAPQHKAPPGPPRHRQ